MLGQLELICTTMETTIIPTLSRQANGVGRLLSLWYKMEDPKTLSNRMPIPPVES
jgi:hypothetical protein